MNPGGDHGRTAANRAPAAVLGALSPREVGARVGDAVSPVRLPVTVFALLGAALVLDLAGGGRALTGGAATLLQLAATAGLLWDARRRRVGYDEGGVRAVAAGAAALAVLSLFAFSRLAVFAGHLAGALDPRDAAHAMREYAGVLFLAGIAALAVRGRAAAGFLARLHLRPLQTLCFSFGAAAVAGALLLALPFSVYDTGRISLLDALFTATSAVCVTGLSVVDIAVEYTWFGQAVVLVLMQAGGLGMMSLYAAAAAWQGDLSARRERELATASGIELRGELRASLRFIFASTFAIEGFGAFLLYPVFSATRPDTALWDAVFHAVSAFCNAGFSTVPGGLGDYRRVTWLLGVMGLLVVLGGLGYPVLADMGTAVRRRTRPRSTHLRLVLATSAVLLAAGTLGLLVLEWNRSLQALGFADRLANASFLSASARTGGFDLRVLDKAGPAGAVLLMGLMLVGASPASTGGGVKTTTLAVLALTLRAVVRREKEVRMFGREVPAEDVLRASAIAASAAAVLGLGIVALLALEPLPPFALVFEAVSALTTTGLSLGITPQLGTAGRLVVTVLMFVGRLGPLTLLTAFLVRRRGGAIRYPRESVMFG